jgi:hypothetical protein
MATYLANFRGSKENSLHFCICREDIKLIYVPTVTIDVGLYIVSMRRNVLEPGNLSYKMKCHRSQYKG